MCFLPIVNIYYIVYILNGNWTTLSFSLNKGHGDWSEWSNFGRCSNMCGKGAQLRTRTCTDPEPMNGGSYCLGPASEQIECFEKPCEGTYSVYKLCKPLCERLKAFTNTNSLLLISLLKIIKYDEFYNNAKYWIRWVFFLLNHWTFCAISLKICTTHAICNRWMDFLVRV